MNVICNTTLLIALASIGHLTLLPTLYTSITTPQAVIDELQAGGAIVVPDLAQTAWVQVVPNITTFEDHLLFQLDYGERHVVLNALKLQADLVLIDDRTARNIAEY
jgi:predicted nucleic acid-binding protein